MCVISTMDRIDSRRKAFLSVLHPRLLLLLLLIAMGYFKSDVDLYNACVRTSGLVSAVLRDGQKKYWEPIRKQNVEKHTHKRLNNIRFVRVNCFVGLWSKEAETKKENAFFFSRRKKIVDFLGGMFAYSKYCTDVCVCVCVGVNVFG